MLSHFEQFWMLFDGVTDETFMAIMASIFVVVFLVCACVGIRFGEPKGGTKNKNN